MYKRDDRYWLVKRLYQDGHINISEGARLLSVSRNTLRIWFKDDYIEKPERKCRSKFLTDNEINSIRKSGYNHCVIAMKLGYSPGYISNVLNKNCRASLNLITNLNDLLGIDIARP